MFVAKEIHPCFAAAVVEIAFHKNTEHGTFSSVDCAK